MACLSPMKDSAPAAFARGLRVHGTSGVDYHSPRGQPGEWSRPSNRLVHRAGERGHGQRSQASGIVEAQGCLLDLGLSTRAKALIEPRSK